MRIVEPCFEIMDVLDGQAILKKLELCGRVCYKSESRIHDESAEKFLASIIARGHESILEHVSFTVRFIIDRGVSHELVRHRMASFSQESTRYCNYGNEDEITVIDPLFYDRHSPHYREWKTSCYESERTYMALLQMGSTPEKARTVLPNSLKTEVIVSANVREWRHILNLRTAKPAHPQIREVMIPLLNTLKQQVPVIFDDIDY